MKKLLIGSLLIIVFVSLCAEEAGLRPYRLINADKLIIEKINDQYITYLQGNVHFFYGETECYTDSAEVFEKQKITRMIGNVKVYDDTLSLFAEEVEYYRLVEEFYLSDDVLFREDHADSTFRTFEAERMNYYRNNKEIEAFDNVIAYDSNEKIEGKCGILKYGVTDGYGYLMQHPIIKVFKQDSLLLSSEKFEYYNDFKKIVANFNVVTQNKDFQINSNFLIYFSEENKATYLGEPRLITEFADATAKEFRIFFNDENQIKTAVLQDSCIVHFAKEKGGEKMNRVSSDIITFTFNDGKINGCVAENNVNSYYEQEKTIEEDFYTNRINGDKMILEIIENEIQKISMGGDVNGVIKFQSQ